jgi:hypothetical protein
MKKAILTILTGAALAVGSAQAAIVFGNLGSNGDGAIDTSGGTVLTPTVWRAFAFTPSGTDLVLNTATLGLSTTVSGTAVIRLDLYSNNAGIPGTSFFNTSLTLGASTSAQPITFTLDQSLTAGQTYWLVAQRDGGTGANNVLAWRRGIPNTAPTAQNSSGWVNVGAKTSNDDGATWENLTAGANNAISLTASAIPEPGTWAAMAILAGGAAFAGWRRRQQHVA